jgi:hypothetical protein
MMYEVTMTVEMEIKTCTCIDQQRRRPFPCKHMFLLVRRLRQERGVDAQVVNPSLTLLNTNNTINNDNDTNTINITNDNDTIDDNDNDNDTPIPTTTTTTTTTADNREVRGYLSYVKDALYSMYHQRSDTQQLQYISVDEAKELADSVRRVEQLYERIIARNQNSYRSNATQRGG